MQVCAKGQLISELGDWGCLSGKGKGHEKGKGHHDHKGKGHQHEKGKGGKGKGKEHKHFPPPHEMALKLAEQNDEVVTKISAWACVC